LREGLAEFGDVGNVILKDTIDEAEKGVCGHRGIGAAVGEGDKSIENGASVREAGHVIQVLGYCPFVGGLLVRTAGK